MVFSLRTSLQEKILLSNVTHGLHVWCEAGAGEDTEWADWRDELGAAVCLFCPATYHDTALLLQHMNLVHGFDFATIKTDLKLNFYQQVNIKFLLPFWLREQPNKS